MQAEVLLFDLGGVLVEWEGVESLAALSGGRLDVEASRRFWLHSPWVSKHDVGLCPVEAFADGVIAELGLALTREAFLAVYPGWVKDAYPGAPALLEQLKGRYRLATLTNNNAVHFERITRTLDLGRYFDDVFASHEMHMKKPDPAIYREVTARLGVAPERIAYFDDNIECVEQGRASGWQAFHTVGLGAVRAALVELGALSAP
jgi:putative hydrolase of the HAD superfamily